MAKRNKGRTKRTDNDFYPTPQPLCDAVCKRLSQLFPDPQYIIEPSAGSGNFVYAIKQSWPNKPCWAMDIRHEAKDQCEAKGADSFVWGDWPTILNSWEPNFPGLVIGNPPFSQAELHITSVLDIMPATSSVAFLLKMNFFGGKNREQVLWKMRQFKYLIPIVGRPSFKKTELASNDTNEYGVFIWEVGFLGQPIIIFPHIEWK